MELIPIKKKIETSPLICRANMKVSIRITASVLKELTENNLKHVNDNVSRKGRYIHKERGIRISVINKEIKKEPNLEIGHFRASKRTVGYSCLNVFFFSFSN